MYFRVDFQLLLINIHDLLCDKTVTVWNKKKAVLEYPTSMAVQANEHETNVQ